MNGVDHPLEVDQFLGCYALAEPTLKVVATRITGVVAGVADANQSAAWYVASAIRRTADVNIARIAICEPTDASVYDASAKWTIGIRVAHLAIVGSTVAKQSCLFARANVGCIAVVAGHARVDVVGAVLAMQGQLAMAVVAQVDVDHLVPWGWAVRGIGSDLEVPDRCGNRDILTPPWWCQAKGRIETVGFAILIEVEERMPLDRHGDAVPSEP
jgi:hypothetical protein